MQAAFRWRWEQQSPYDAQESMTDSLPHHYLVQCSTIPMTITPTSGPIEASPIGPKPSDRADLPASAELNPSPSDRIIGTAIDPVVTPPESKATGAS